MAHNPYSCASTRCGVNHQMEQRVRHIPADSADSDYDRQDISDAEALATARALMDED